jgi:hypothetical protein
VRCAVCGVAVCGVAPILTQKYLFLNIFADVTQEKAVCGKKIKKEGLGRRLRSWRRLLFRAGASDIRCLYAICATKFPFA